MESMPRPRPPQLHREVTRHGKAVWYVRLDKGKRIRIKAEFGTPDFEAEYQAAINGRPKAVKGTAAGSLAWLFEQYREAQVWRDLSLETRKQREAIMRQMIRSAGNQPFAKITQATIVAGRDRRGTTPAQARHFLETMRGLFKWATKAKHVTANPTIGVEDPARPKGGGIPIWTEEQVAAYERRWPIGGNGCGLTCFFIPDCAAGTRSSLAVSTFAMELRR
jgi:hypothetical protein